METIRRTKIVDLLQREDFGATVSVKGWVRTRRGNKQVSFINLNDGSTVKNIQVVVDLQSFEDEFLKPITTGACIHVVGKLVESQGQGQKGEIQAEQIEIYGTADPQTYPLQKKGHTLEFLRDIAHLRPRTNTFGAIFRMRHHMAFAIHKYFNDKGFYYFHTPILTASDAEGAGSMFQATAFDLNKIPHTEEGKIDYSEDFFGRPTNLTEIGRAHV